MKAKFITGLLFAGMTNLAIAQEIPAPPAPPASPANEEKSTDTTRLKFGDVHIVIFEDKKNDEVVVQQDSTDNSHRFTSKKKGKKSESTWSGFYLGVNGMLTYDNQLTAPAPYNYMELDYSKSVTCGLNFGELSFKIIPNYLSITTGLGIQWNRYGLKNNYTLQYTQDTLTGLATPTIAYSKNVLKATYLQIPLLLEIHTSKYHKKAFHISAGVIGGYKLGSRLKQKYTVDGQDYKNITKGHYQLNPFQAYATARIGYGNVNVFMNYGLTRIFEKGKGPQFYPVTVGIYLPLD